MSTKSSAINKVLVTGGAGFIGSHVAEACIAGGYEVHILDNLSSGSADNLPEGAFFHQLDLRDPAIETLFAEEQFPVVIHHAAQLDVRKSVAAPAFDADVNVLGFLRLMEAGRKYGLKRFVFASTGGAIYGETDVLPQNETNELHPESPYGITKLATEKYLYFYEKVHGISSVILRYANVYGPRQGSYGEAGVIAIFIKKIMAGEAPVIFGDGEQTRDYVYVGDVVRANLLAIEAAGSGTYNIGTGVETSVITLIAKLQGLMQVPVAVKHEAARAGEVRRSALSYDRINNTLGWSPQVTLDKGLAETVRWFNSRITPAL
ncbi:MAG: NAD-dependent epimerase/dehydratase family protein [Bacteroidota bacterium]